MPHKNKLSIYLIKDKYASDDNQILKSPNTKLGDIENLGTAYYMPSAKTVPQWLNTFYCGKLSDKNLFTANVKVVLIVRIDVKKGITKTFAVTMGYGKSLLENDVVENDFGLKVVLNTIKPNSLRRINKVNIGGNQKTSNEQLPLSSKIDDFGFDMDRDLISTVTGRSEDKTIVEGLLTGSDMLSLNVAVDITNLKDYLKIVYEKYCSKEYRKNFGWIDHIRKVKDTKIIKRLEEMIVELINNNSPNIWMAVPDVIEWENISGFKYAGDELEEDIDIIKVVNSFRKGLNTYEQLRSKTIEAISAQDNTSVYLSWKAYKCLYGEVELDDKAYCINSGNWYLIDKDFVKQVNKDYENIKISDMEFMDCLKCYSTENAYSTAFVKTNPDYLLCMDKKNIYHGGGQSQIEVCDILTTDKKYIHIKPYSGSSTLSHLFNQSVVSAELILSDKEFLGKANKKIEELTDNKNFLIDGKKRPHVILGIISKKDTERPELPFFSKVALRYTKRRLEAYGCMMEIKNIRKIEGEA